MEIASNSYIIALTANNSDDDQNDCMESGMNGFISKPIGINTLKKSISEFDPNWKNG